MLYMLILTSLLWSNENAPPAAGHGNAAGPEQSQTKNEVPGWVKLQGEIQTMQGKISVQQSNMEKLLLQKKSVKPGSAQAKSVVEELIKTHKELKKLVDEYRHQEAILKFRYPERGQKERQAFELPDMKSLSVLEAEVGVDYELTRNMELIRSKYQEKKREPAEEKVENHEGQKKKSVLDSPAPQL